jgi:hypothetical protein
VRVLSAYSSFFAATTSASAALIGLLFVALTIANQGEDSERARALRDALAGASFAQLVDGLFVSVAGLSGDIHVFTGLCVTMGAIGLWATSQWLPRVIRTGSWSPTAPRRKRMIALPIGSITIYVAQIALGLSLVFDGNNVVLLRITALLILGLFAGALLRSWEMART